MTRSFLASVVAALESEGQSVVSHTEGRDGHGSPPEWRMSEPMDRGHVETLFDLGPLAWWFMGPDGGWVLVDTLTQSSLHGTGKPVPFDATRRPATGGRHLAHVGDQPGLCRQWSVPSVDDEIEVLEGRPLRVRGPNRTSAVTVGGAPEATIERVRDVMAVVSRLHRGAQVAELAHDLPDWFLAVCAPHRTPDEWAAWVDEAYADPALIRFKRWEASWTAEAWLQAMVPDERTWWFAEAVLAGTEHVLLTILTPGLRAPSASLSWLLHAAGATTCRPAAAPSVDPLVLETLPVDQRRDPDDALAAAARELLGREDPLVLEAVPRTGSCRWETRMDVSLDTDLLDRRLAPDSGLTAGADRRSSWLTNGWSTIIGPPRVVIEDAKKPWWRR